jgi:hypothetical protein
MAGRRLIAFVVLLLLVAAVASAIAPREDQVAPRRTQPSPQPPVTAAARIVQGVLPDDRRVHAQVGDVVQLRVRHAAQDEVQILALGVSEPVEPGIDAQLVFDADREGRFPVTLRDGSKRLGTVVVRPAG